MYNAQQVRTKQRAAVRRREEDVEQMELEGGEINLIPYLDIVTNLLLFVLASVSAGMILGQINTTLPDRSQSATPQNPDIKPDDLPLRVVVSVTKDRIILWSFSGLEGTISQPKATFPRIGKEGEPCDGEYMCESNKCDSTSRTCCGTTRTSKCPAPPTPENPQWVYDFRGLNKALFEIANRRYGNKVRKKITYQAVLMPDDSVPYGTIVSVMGAMRCLMPELGKESVTCMLPTDDERLKKAQDPIDPIGRVYDTDRAPYDPNKMALFQDVVFSPGVVQ